MSSRASKCRLQHFLGQISSPTREVEGLRMSECRVLSVRCCSAHPLGIGLSCFRSGRRKLRRNSEA
jgi:hypothetical protein